jgi:hypothetical protein
MGAGTKRSMSELAFPYDVFLSHSAKDKAVVRPLSGLLPFAFCLPPLICIPLRLDNAPITFTDLQEHRITMNN